MADPIANTRGGAGVNVGCGESVAQGQAIGWLGDTAGSAQPYLSFAIFNQGIPFPPLQKLSGRP